MDCEASARVLLERMLLDTSAEPTALPLSLLRSITNNFSDDQQIGSGGFAVVYEGILQNGTVAVKRLSLALDMDENNFNREVISLIRVKHKNIVRFLGYCADTQGKVEKYMGKMVIADVRQRLLCFEFMPNGSLDKYINDASTGLEWRTRYKIIKGICEGLHYLHQKKIVHLDLKPANILLDHNMVPKIADFGLSKCFDETQTRAITSKVVGTQGYMAPEFYSGVITLKSDIYSLGVIIIEILTGQKGCLPIENVLESWSTRFQTSHGGMWLEHVRVCAEIGLECMDSNPVKRPMAQNIIEMLDGLDLTHGFFEIDLSTTHLFKDKAIKVVGSKATSNVTGPSTDNPQTGDHVVPQSHGTVYNLKLYMQQIISGPNYNQVNIADPKQPEMFGYTNVHDYPIYDSLGPSAMIVARAQGLHTETSLNYDDWFHWSSVVFNDERFQGSSFMAIGNQNKVEGEWVIVGGTGVFTFAQGTISIYRILESESSNIKEICIRAFGCIGRTTPIETKHFKHNVINIDSNATSNVCNSSMPNRQIQSILYMHQIISGSNYNQVNIADPKQPQMFGYTNVHDYPIYDSLGSDRKIVARAQGLHTKTSMDNGGWFHWSKVAFDYERFPGSSFNAIGNQEGEWAIVGGTGQFTFARGTISTCRIQDNGFSNIKEIRIRALCCEPTIPSKFKLFKDKMINIDSNASPKTWNPSMANPQSGPVTIQSQKNEYNRILYMQQIISGPNYNQVNIADPKQPEMFGYTNVHDYPIYDSLGPGKKVVARAQGLHTETSMNYSGWFHWSSVVFTDERFRGSSLKALGNQEGEWAIVGGTGMFTFAEGTITTYRVQDSGSSNIKEIRIHALLCCTPNITPTDNW